MLELLQRLLPLTVQPQQLAAVDRALAGERQQPGLGGTPAFEGCGPLRHPPEVADLLAALDRGAVDVPGHDRGGLARDHPDHRLVEQGEAIGDPAGVERHPALGAEPQRDEVGFAETQAALGHLVGAGAGRGEVARGQSPEHS